MPCVFALHDLLERDIRMLAKRAPGHLDRAELPAGPAENRPKVRAVKPFGENLHVDQYLQVTGGKLFNLPLAVGVCGDNLCANSACGQ